MKLQDIMSRTVVSIHPEETVAVAARTLERHNIGALPVCGEDGRLRGVITDRDLVTRCVAAGRAPEQTKVREIMTGRVITATGDMDSAEAARLMGSRQIRRLPVVEDGVLRGMVSLGDLAVRQESVSEAAGALESISDNVSRR